MLKRLVGSITRSRVTSGLLVLLLLTTILVATTNRRGNVTLTLGTRTVSAAGVADATADGTADNVEAQTLVTALPATGGRVSILTGVYSWAAGATVTRAINGVTISGTGIGTNITLAGGATSPFTAGGNNWVIENIQVGVTTAVFEAAMGATTGWEWRNVTTSDGYFTYKTDDATTATSWDIPTGRGATYLVAASDAPAHVRGQADYLADGAADEVQIQAAIDALPTAGGTVLLSDGTFNVDAAITPRSYITIQGSAGTRLVVTTDGIVAIVVAPWPWADTWSYLNADSANWTVEAGAAVLSDEAVIYAQGTGSLEAAVAGVPFEIKRTFAAVDLSTYAVLSAWVRPEFSGNVAFSMRLWSGANYIQWDYDIGQPGRFTEVFGSLYAYDTISGAFDSSAVTAISFLGDQIATYYFDEIKAMMGYITLDGFTGTTLTTLGDDSWLTFNRVAFSNINNVRIENANDEALEIHGSRGINVTNSYLSQRYTPTVSGGGPVLDMGPAQNAGAAAGDVVRNRFNKITNTHIYRGESAGITLAGDSNIIDGVTINGLSGTAAGNRTGIEIRHTYTTNNTVRNTVIDEVNLGINITEGAYGNFIDNVAVTLRQVGTAAVQLATAAGDYNVINNIRAAGTNTAGVTGIGVNFVSGNGDYTKITNSDFNNLATGISSTVATIAGLVVSDNTFRNLTTGMTLTGAARSDLRNNRFITVTTPLSGGINTEGDLTKESVSLDLSGAATDVVVWTPNNTYRLIAVEIVYTEASSADAGVVIRVGRLTTAGALDDDYYWTGTSLTGQALGFYSWVAVGSLLQTSVSGNSITVGTAGGKAGTGEVKFVLTFIRNTGQ